MPVCAKMGCKARPVKGEIFCRSHSGGRGAGSSAGGPTKGAAVSSLYRRFFTAQERAALEEAGGIPGLEQEIAALRVAIMRLLEAEEDPARVVSGVAKGVAEIVRAMRAEHVLSGGSANDLIEATDRIISELAQLPQFSMG